MSKKELTKFRTANSKYILNDDKTISVQLYKENIYYWDGKKYNDIDNTIIKTKNGYKNKKNNFKIEFDNNDKDKFINIKKDRNYINLIPLDRKKLKVKVNKEIKSIKNIDNIKY